MPLVGLLDDHVHEVLVDGDEAPVDFEDEVAAVALEDFDPSGAQEGHERRVPRKDAHGAVVGRHGDVPGLSGPHASPPVDDLDLHERRVRGHQPCSFSSLCHARSMSSIPPMLKKACSGMWSYSPSARRRKASTVSSTGTVEPSTPVNFTAV